MKKDLSKTEALLAKELGLKEDLITPSGEGLKSKVSNLEKDLNGVGKKLNDIQKNQDILFQKLTEKEVKEKTSDKSSGHISLLEQTIHTLTPIVKGVGRVLKPVFIVLGVIMLGMIAKALDIHLPISILGI